MRIHSLLLSTLFLTAIVTSFGQSVGIGTNTPSTNAALHVVQGATPQGLIIPVISGADMTTLDGLVAIADAGLMIYNPDSSAIMVWGGVSWSKLGAATGGVTSVATGTGLTGGPITSTGTISLAPTAVTAGTYGTSSSVAQITIDAEGRITSATDIAIPGTNSPVDSVTAGTGIQVVYSLDTANISLSNTSVTPGNYGSATEVATFTVDAQGRITNASSTAITGDADWVTGGGFVSNTTDNIGIGIANPSTELHVVGTTRTDSLSVINGASFGNDVRMLNNLTVLNDIFVQGGGWINIVSGNLDADSVIINGIKASGTYGTAGQVLTSGGAGAPMTWGNSSGDNLGNHIATTNIQLGVNYLSGDGGAEGVFVDGAGNVGIGNNAPGSLLEVSGNVDILTTLDVGGNIDQASGTANLNALNVANGVSFDVVDAALATTGLATYSGTGAINGAIGFGGTGLQYLRDDGNFAFINSDHLSEGSTNLFITPQRVSDAIQGVAGIVNTFNGGSSKAEIGLDTLLATAGVVGSTTEIPVLTYNRHGRITNVATALVAGSADGDTLWDHIGRQNVAMSGFSISNDGGAGEGLSFDNAGNAAIGGAPSATYKLYVYGKLKSDGITEMSDKRLKKDIHSLEGALASVQQMRGVTYNWRQENPAGIAFEKGLQIGLIAQEVEAIFPELVDTDDQGFKSVEYSKLVAVLIEALKEQQAQINSLQSQNGDLQEVKAEIELLKAQLNKYGMK